MDRSLNTEQDLKPDFEPAKSICRCCMSTEKRMLNASKYQLYFQDLAGINVSENNGLPQCVCYECAMLLQKAVRFKHKLLRAHHLLYNYLTRCAPFPIDAEDPELGKYASPNLSATSTLSIDFGGRSRLGFQKPLENIAADAKPEVKKKKKVKKKEKSKKKKNSDTNEEEPPTKTSIRRTIELDPTKIRVVILNPEEQVKQREEESKASLKFPFQCTLCYKGFNFESKLENHMSKHSPSRGSFECKLCHMFLPTSYSYNVHSLIHTRRYECLKCLRRMTDRSSIVDHYRTQHEGLLTLFTCHVCGKVSSNCKTHRGHMRNHHSGDRPKCDQCGKSFVNKDSLAEHMQIHQGIKNYECSTCGKRFRTRTQIKHHQLKHTDVRNYYCVECDSRFKSAHSLRQHLLKSSKHKDMQSLKFACARCPRRYVHERALAAHVRVQHEGERAHACARCGAALASRASLRKHELSVHAGRRPAAGHVCDTCGKAFRGKSILTNHVRTHTGEKPFECNQCGRKFTQRTAMRTHINLVHLKIRRQAKIKPEIPLEVREQKMDIYTKNEQPLDYEGWSRPQMGQCDVYFQVTAGP
ncbi:LOW QUALITY PROTEIN: uncharacterized protein ACR2FA_010362 [Aphomia sociella]